VAPPSWPRPQAQAVRRRQQVRLRCRQGGRARRVQPGLGVEATAADEGRDQRPGRVDVSGTGLCGHPTADRLVGNGLTAPAMSGPPAALAAVRVAVRRDLAAGLADGLEAGDLVLVACSGGADSLALLAATAFEAPKAGLRFGVVTVDPCWRPQS